MCGVLLPQPIDRQIGDRSARVERPRDGGEVAVSVASALVAVKVPSLKFLNTMTADPLSLSVPLRSVFEVTTHASPPPAARASVLNPQSTPTTTTARIIFANLIDSPRSAR